MYDVLSYMSIAREFKYRMDTTVQLRTKVGVVDNKKGTYRKLYVPFTAGTLLAALRFPSYTQVTRF